MGENEPHRFIQAEQPFLVLHNQVVSVCVVGGPCFFVRNLTLHKAGLSALFLVDGEVTLVGAVDIDLVQVLQIGRVVNFSPQFLHNALILRFKEFGVFPVAAIVTVPVVQAVFCHLVDKEQAEHFDAFGVEFPLSVEMCADGLSNLHAALKRGHLFIAADLSGKKLQAVQECHRVLLPIDAVWTLR